MPRVKRGFKARRRRNRVLKHAKGYYGARRKAFHVAIELSASVQTFSFLAVAVLFVWADPDLRRLGPVQVRRCRSVAAASVDAASVDAGSVLNKPVRQASRAALSRDLPVAVCCTRLTA